MLPVFPPSGFDAQSFATYNPYGYSTPFPTTYGTPLTAAVAQPSAAPLYYQDPAYVKTDSSSSSCSRSESDVSSGSEEAYRRTSRLRRKAREGRVLKEAEVLQQQNDLLKGEVGELKKVLYTLQDEVRVRLNTIDVENVENNVQQFQQCGFSYHTQNL
ncbi:unnamed protein product [Nippostrongylus brasiliensis]|uniref:BZIP domain-containing protein n=1 Tax=Nippostrongylus brasiliensis TaxID=27835 RepID=A0A0N4YS97_NIPBR|nr:unnamed protein product [Nippostrongylus brasiliensis]